MTDPRLIAIVDHLRKGISLPLTRHNAAALLVAVDAADTRGIVPFQWRRVAELEAVSKASQESGAAKR